MMTPARQRQGRYIIVVGFRVQGRGKHIHSNSATMSKEYNNINNTNTNCLEDSRKCENHKATSLLAIDAFHFPREFRVQDHEHGVACEIRGPPPPAIVV